LPLSLGWRLDANGHLTDAHIIQYAGQTLFLTSSLGRMVYAMREDGKLAWHLRTEGPVYTMTLLDSDHVAVGDDAGHVTLIATNGQRLWQTDLGSRVTSLLGGWQDGILAGGWDERLSLLDSGGTLRWQARLDGPLSQIASLPGLALAATHGGQVSAHDSSGAKLWHFEARSPVVGLETISEGSHASLLLSLQDGRLLALDPEGQPRWQQSLGSGGPVLQIADLADGDSPAILAGTGGQEPQMMLLSAAGQVLWRVAVPSPVMALTTSDLDGDGRLEILAGLGSGQLQAYDQQGRLHGSVHAGLPVWGIESGSGGSVLVLADVTAWRLKPSAGPAGRPWLSPPAMLQTPPAALPSATQRAENEAILVFLGDVSPGRSMERQLARYGPQHPWRGLEPLLRGADLAAANLECVLTTQGKPMDKSYLIRAHPRWGQTLVEAGFDLVTLANNHALDFGQAGLDETLVTLQGLDVAAIGAGSSRAEARGPAIFDLNGVRIALLSYAAARWDGSADVPATDRVAWARPAAVQTDVRAIREQVDLVVVLLHAGTEYARTPSPDQVAVARAAIDAGADLVAGHHSHVAQTVERYRQGLIVYGLGDALFDIPRTQTRQGDLLRIHATRDGLAQVELWPHWIDGAIRPRLLEGRDGEPAFEIIYP
jgi:poly-gamma-glutamate synthesis protein (capsule biosynthesis protein)